MSSDGIQLKPRLGADLAGLEPFQAIGRRWPMLLGGLLTLAMVVGLARELLGSGLEGLGRLVPASPLFYLAFAILYLSPPSFDYLIFRRLWGIPGDGLLALIRKRIANDVLFGYSGDAYFYAWARQRAHLVAAPFGAVKDSTILSAVAGNMITLAMIVVALPVAWPLLDPAMHRRLLMSTIVILAMSLPFLIFSKRVFSLPRPTLWWVFSVHCLRMTTGSIAIALAWHFALPGAPLGMWLLLAALRLLVSRLPLVPNKELLFANLAILLIGQAHGVTAMVAFTAALTLLAHVVLIVIFGVHHLIRHIRTRN